MNLQDTSQWLSVTEETLFMHDGLVRVSDLVELPLDVNLRSEDDGQEMVSFDSKDPNELSENLKAVCGTQNNSYTRLLEYRLNAVKGLWNAQYQIALEEESDKEGSNEQEAVSQLKKHGLWKDTEHFSFSNRVSLLLVIPLIQSQSKLDSSLAGITAELLLNCLKDCPPLSLSKEPNDCLNGIEKLLCVWLEEEHSEHDLVESQKKRETAASALVALAAARLNSFILLFLGALLNTIKSPFM